MQLYWSLQENGISNVDSSFLVVQLTFRGVSHHYFIHSQNITHNQSEYHLVTMSPVTKLNKTSRSRKTGMIVILFIVELTRSKATHSLSFRHEIPIRSPHCLPGKALPFNSLESRFPGHAFWLLEPTIRANTLTLCWPTVASVLPRPCS